MHVFHHGLALSCHILSQCVSCDDLILMTILLFPCQQRIWFRSNTELTECVGNWGGRRFGPLSIMIKFFISVLWRMLSSVVCFSDRGFHEETAHFPHFLLVSYLFYCSVMELGHCEFFVCVCQDHVSLLFGKTATAFCSVC